MRCDNINIRGNTRIICSWLNVAPGSYAPTATQLLFLHTLASLTQTFRFWVQVFLGFFFLWEKAKGEKRSKTKWWKMTLHILLWWMWNGARPSHLPAATDYSINHVISRGNRWRGWNACLHVLKWGHFNFFLQFNCRLILMSNLTLISNQMNVYRTRQEQRFLTQDWFQKRKKNAVP